MVMSLRVAFASALSFFLACTGGASSTTGGDGGADDAGTGTTSCTQESGDVCAAGTAMRCEGAAPPGCLTTTTANVYCCGAVPEAGVDDGGDTDGGKATSPDGVPYPTTNIGWNARTGSKPGQTIPNVTLPGYAANSATLTNVSMADLFDPNGKTHDAIVLLAVSVWDVYSPKAMEIALASKRRVRVLSVLGEGTAAGTPSTAANLTSWRARFPKATHMHDPGFKAFGPAFDAAAVPLTMIISAKTMEICSSGVGAQLSQTTLDSDIDACVR